MEHIITFDQRCKLQARWLQLKSRKTGVDEVTLAVNFGERLAEKISKKYFVLMNKTLKGN